MKRSDASGERAAAELLESSAEPASPVGSCLWSDGDPPDRCRYRNLTEFLNRSLGLDELINACVAYVHALVRAERVRIWLYRHGGRRLLCREFAPTFTEGFREMYVAAGEGLPGRAATQGRVVILGSSSDSPEYKDEQPGWKSALVVPLERRGQILGVIECLDRAGGGTFSEVDARSLEAAAREFAVAIENAQLYFDVRRRAAERATLLRVARSLSQPLTLSATLEAILDGLRRLVTYDAGAIFLLSKDGSLVEAHLGRGYPETWHPGVELSIGQGIVGWVAKTGESIIVPDTSKDNRYVLARARTRSEMACPLIAEGKVMGVFNLESDRKDTYTEAHLEVLHAFASQAAAAIERARLLEEVEHRRQLERELAIARQIQISFLPKSDPVVPGFDVHGLNLPYSEVGGDYFDFIPIVENQLGVAISDVSGKGIPAALLMAAYRAMLLAEIRNQFALRTILAKVNTLLHESTDRGKFVTAFYGVLDSKNRIFTFSNAGHDPPILRRANGTVERLTEGGLALGVLPDSQYEERPTSLSPGDTILCYTDGVSEAAAPDGEQFGPERVVALLEEVHASSARDIVDALVRRVTAFTQGAEHLTDDLTVLCVKCLEGPRK
ncbi:MAG TPA: SpoIIE family protein phosphatase [Candidatus Eisenbacteria bacterium]|nr:SpoIIE family protein phosphatase [Candidatus Eisenbacteria bacterium]